MMVKEGFNNKLNLCAKSESSVVTFDPNTGFVIPPPRPAVQYGRIAP